MDDSLPPNQQEVVDLLETLGKSEVNYPPELMAHARAAFQYKVSAAQAQMLESGSAFGEAQAAGYGSAAAEGGTTLFAWQTATKVALATALVSAIAYGAYLLSEFLPTLLEPNPTVVYVTPVEIIEVTPEITETAEPTATPVPPVILEGTPERDHPGLQLGRTPGPPAAPGQTKTPKVP